ncbi:hypothetical protein FXN61_06750 [Lentzea sp. PSKA42]|uniref:Uncharacterized protein n=1 Tax=Lentzea indica TaxID=2604800 RepID=A0ABX1FCV4_9PSEU|nr:hypothetical protein [Lentzea indica]NKE56546.1 hypothetical protein [Lentzea indica]
MTQRPPAELDGAEVFSFAPVGAAQKPTGGTVHSVSDFPDVVRGLALARYSGEKTVYLFYCDEESNVVSDTAHSSVEEAIDQARFEFEGLEFEPLP